MTDAATARWAASRHRHSPTSASGAPSSSFGYSFCTFRAASSRPLRADRRWHRGRAARSRIFRGAAADSPDDVWPRLWLARALHAAGDADGALEALLAALALEPRSLATVEWATALLADDVAGRRDAFGEAVDRARAGGSAALSPLADAARSLALGDAVGAWSRLRHVPSLASGGDVLARIADALRLDGHLHSSVQVYDRLLETHLENPDIRQARDTVDGELRVLTGASPMPRPGLPVHTPGTPARAARRRAFASRGPERCTLRTHAIARAQRAVGIDAHVVTELGFPGDPGKGADRSCEVIDGVPYHRLGPGRAVPDRLDTRLNTNAAELLDLVKYIRPAILHAASDYRNALLSLTVGAACGLPVIYEMRGFWEDTWRAGLGPSRQPGERYDLLRAREVACARSADVWTCRRDARSLGAMSIGNA